MKLIRLLPRIVRPDVIGILIALVVVAAPGCSRGSAGHKLDACGLVSAKQAQAVLGTPITVHPVDTSAAGPNAASMCRYSGGGIGFMLLASRLSYKDAAAEMASRKHQVTGSFKANLGRAPEITDLKGLGEAAFLVEEPGFMQVHVLKDKTVVVVNMSAQLTPENIDHAKRLAAIAIKHI